MQNIHVERYEHPERVGYHGLVRPEDGGWILFIPADGGMPQLLMEVEVPADEADDNPEAMANGAKTIKGYAPAIYLDDRVTVKPDVDPTEGPCPNLKG